MEELWFGASLFGIQLGEERRRVDESGGDKETEIAGMTGRDDWPPSSGCLDDGIGSRQGSLMGEVSPKARCGGDVIFRERLLLPLAVDYRNTT